MQHYSDLLKPLGDTVYCGANSINVFADAFEVPRADSFTCDDIKFIYHRWLTQNQIVTGNKYIVEVLMKLRESNPQHNDN